MSQITITVVLAPHESFKEQPDPSWPRPPGVTLQLTGKGKKPIELIFYQVTSFIGEPQNLIFQEMRWEPRSRLGAFNFVDGDRDFIAEFSAS